MVSSNMSFNKKGFMRIVVSSALASTLIISGVDVFANAESGTAYHTATDSYNDYQSGQYWSEDMLWNIENGYIQGYLNSNHPSSGALGNWLDPYGELKEAQMITILLRYFKGDELKSTVAIDSSYWASTAYQLAKKYSLPTKASLSNRYGAFSVTTRGALAQNLATLHFGKNVTMQQAVQFMYDSGISTGYADESGNYPRTYDSYKVNQPLKRAHIVSFIKRYDDYAKSKNEVPSTGGSTPSTETPTNGGSTGGSDVTSKKDTEMTVSELLEKYGEHIMISRSRVEHEVYVVDWIQRFHDWYRDGYVFVDSFQEWFDTETEGNRGNYEMYYPYHEVISYNGKAYANSEMYLGDIRYVDDSVLPRNPSLAGQFLADVHLNSKGVGVYLKDDVAIKTMNELAYEISGREVMVEVQPLLGDYIKIEQNGSTLTLTGPSGTLEVTANSTSAKLNGNNIELSNKVITKNGKLLVPVREVAQKLGLYTRIYVGVDVSKPDQIQRIEVANYPLASDHIFIK
jgi:hypothetical protein